MGSIKRVFGYLLCIAMLLSMVGCGKGVSPKKLSVEIALKPSVYDRIVEVDLAGVSATDLPAWEQVNLATYWDPGDSDRFRADQRDRLHTIEFPAGGSASGKVHFLSQNAPIWTVWFSEKGASNLVILAHIGGVAPKPTPGNANPLRAILPLAKSRWKNTNIIKIEIGLGGIDVLTPLSPEE